MQYVKFGNTGMDVSRICDIVCATASKKATPTRR